MDGFFSRWEKAKESSKKSQICWDFLCVEGSNGKDCLIGIAGGLS